MKLLIGTLLGFLSGLGVGGGSLLVLWLTLVLDIDPATARGVNLLFFLPSGAVACFFRWKEGTLRFRPLLPAILSGCAAAGLCSWLGAEMEVGWLKKVFGVLLIATGIRELTCRGGG